MFNLKINGLVSNIISGSLNAANCSIKPVFTFICQISNRFHVNIMTREHNAMFISFQFPERFRCVVCNNASLDVYRLKYVELFSMYLARNMGIILSQISIRHITSDRRLQKTPRFR